MLVGFSYVKEKMDLGPTKSPLNFNSNPDHQLVTRNIKDLNFSMYLLLSLLKKTQYIPWRGYALYECFCFLLV